MTDQREDFEEAAARMHFQLNMRDESSEDGEYRHWQTQRAWDMWQKATDKAFAARAQDGGEPVLVACAAVNKTSTGEYEFYPASGLVDLPNGIHKLYTRSPSAVVPEWVKQSERTTDDKCIAYTPNEDTSIMFRIVPERMLRHCFDVTHWMPLPAPPKQEQES